MHAVSVGVVWGGGAECKWGWWKWETFIISSKTINPDEEMSFGIEAAIWSPFNGESAGLVRYLRM